MVVEGRRRAILNVMRTVKHQQDRIAANMKQANTKGEFLRDRREKLRMLRRELERLSGSDAMETIRKWANLPLRKYFRLWNQWVGIRKWERGICAKVAHVLTHRNTAAAFRTWRSNVSDMHRLEEAKARERERAKAMTLSEFLLNRMEGHRRNITKQVLNTLTLLTKTELDVDAHAEVR